MSHASAILPDFQSSNDPNFEANYNKALEAGFVFAQEAVGSKSYDNGVRWVATLGVYKCWNAKLSTVASLAAGYLRSPLYVRHQQEKEISNDTTTPAHDVQAADVDVNPEPGILLEPCGKTQEQTAYKVKSNGLLIGLVFHVHLTNTWRCGNGTDYQYPKEAIAALTPLVLEPCEKTQEQTAYKVKSNGLLIGLVFHVHLTNTWQCGNGKDYQYPKEAIAALAAITQPPTQEPIPSPFTKAAAKRLILSATSIEAVREIKNTIQVTYFVKGKKCSTFVSKKSFLQDFEDIRHQAAADIEVVEDHDDSFVVKSKEQFYVVRPGHENPQQRCECADCYYRRTKCKHQVAVEQYLNLKLQSVA